LRSTKSDRKPNLPDVHFASIVHNEQKMGFVPRISRRDLMGKKRFWDKAFFCLLCASGFCGVLWDFPIDLFLKRMYTVYG